MREDILQSACRESQPSDTTRSVAIQQIVLLGEQEPLDALARQEKLAALEVLDALSDAMWSLMRQTDRNTL